MFLAVWLQPRAAPGAIPNGEGAPSGMFACRCQSIAPPKDNRLYPSRPWIAIHESVVDPTGDGMLKTHPLRLALAMLTLLCFTAIATAGGNLKSASADTSTAQPASAAPAATGPAPPLVLDPPVVLDVLSKDGAKSDIRYLGQPAKDGRIDLTATNGFFDRCFQALDPQPLIPGDEGLIGCSFGYLGRLSDAVPGTARWHLWCAQAGQIKATFFMQVPPAEAGHPWVIQVGDQRQTLPAQPSAGQTPQPQTLTFAVKEPGKVTVAIDCTKTPPAAETRIYYIRLDGSALHQASLLRTRWRPSAAHGHFYAPDNCPAPTMWVFETQDIGKTGSYSPLTTPFGYYGTSFGSGGLIPPGAGFNFSMWLANRNATEAPPIDKMACLIGTAIPGAQYSTFGGEGTGVKFRAAVAYPNGAERTIQALRVEATGDLRTFYGYFYDEPEHRWKLYASAQAPAARKTMSGLLASTGSFCEIPGPPNRERSGDLVREIKRRGWFLGSDQTWYRAQLNRDATPEPADEATAPDAPPAPADAAQKPRARRKAPASSAAAPERPSAKRFYYMNDYATDGWIGMATGGIASYVATPAGPAKPASKAGAAPVLPEYLRPEKTAQLFDLPVLFGASKASAVAADHATIDYEIKKTGPNSQAILYYGTVDALTYPPQTVTKGSAVEIDMYRPGRTWQSATPQQPVTTGINPFKLRGLKPNTTYFYRLFVAHDQGKSWDYRSGRFATEQ